MSSIELNVTTKGRFEGILINRDKKPVFEKIN
jgi:hypothetical protein